MLEISSLLPEGTEARHGHTFSFTPCSYVDSDGEGRTLVLRFFSFFFFFKTASCSDFQVVLTADFGSRQSVGSVPVLASAP